MSKILKEALQDVEVLKEAAVENARNVLVEAISPKIKEFVDSQISAPVVEVEEEEPEELDDMEVEESGMYEAEDKACDDEEEIEETVEITREDLKQALEDVVRESGMNEATVTSGFGEPEDATLPVSGGKGEKGIADEKSGESHWKDEEPPDAEDWTVKEAAYKKQFNKLVASYKNLQKENAEYKKAFSVMKEKLQEVNVFNSKLLYTNKLLQNSDLSSRQRVAVIEAFDKADSLREVQLVYNSLSESLKIAGVLGEAKKTKAPKSSRFVAQSGASSVLKESAESGQDNFRARMEELAGIID